MANQPVIGSINNSISVTARSVLEDTPARVLTFLRGIGTSASIRSAMAAAGYTAADHEEGWKLLFKASGYPPPAATPDDNAVADAIREIDAWDEGGFRRARAALHRLHPVQEAFVFENLEPSSGMQALVGVATFLDRLDALEDGAARKATRKADHAALATLAARGIDGALRKRLRDLLEVAHSCPPVVKPADDAITEADKRTAQLAALRAWFEDWSETARAVIVRRDQRIRIGLAKRKPRGSGKATPVVVSPPLPPAPPVDVIPPAAPAPAPAPANGSSGTNANANGNSIPAVNALGTSAFRGRPVA